MGGKAVAVPSPRYDDPALLNIVEAQHLFRELLTEIAESWPVKIA